MGVLYVISDRQSASTAFELASRERDDVSILLMGEACGLLDDREKRISLEKTGKIYCLGDMENVSSLVEVVDYSGWVRLIEENERSVSWA